MAKKKTIKTKKRKTTRSSSKSVSKSSTKSNEPYFIGLGDPVELRKNILEPTREVIQFLQSYEEFKKIKEEKTHTILILKDDLKELKLYINKLRRLLPRSKVKAEKTYTRIQKEIKEECSEPKFYQPASKSVVSKSAPKPIPQTHPELDSLEKELGDIEKKLGTLV